jgi:hypothetical protein
MIANRLRPGQLKTSKLTYRVALAPAEAEADPPVRADHGPARNRERTPFGIAPVAVSCRTDGLGTGSVRSGPGADCHARPRFGSYQDVYLPATCKRFLQVVTRFPPSAREDLS